MYEWLQDCIDESCNKQGIYLVRPDGRDRHLLSSAAAEHPDWSPDGKRIAVVAEASDNISEIWILDADGTNLTVAACDGAPCSYVAGWPAWSPDGTKLAFSRAIPRGPAEDYDRIAIEVVDLATSATTVVAAPPVASSEYVEYQNPRWSPDGARIVFTEMRYPVPPTDENIQSSAIAIVDADGSGSDSPRIVTDPAMFGAYPDWSPDGQRIVFNTYPLGSFQETTKATNLYTVRPDGTDLTQVTQFGENDTRATESTWTPDGQHIIFTNIERNPANSWGERLIALTDADGSNLTLIPIPAAQQDGHGDAWYGTHARMRPTP